MLRRMECRGTSRRSESRQVRWVRFGGAGTSRSRRLSSIATLTRSSCGRLPRSLVVFAGRRAVTAAEPDGPASSFFEMKVRPILAGHCHSLPLRGGREGEGRSEPGWRAGLLKGGETGPVITPATRRRARLISAVRTGTSICNAPEGQTAGRGNHRLTAWVRMGAPWPADPHEVAGRAGFDPSRRKVSALGLAADAANGSPARACPSRPLAPVDHFLLASSRQGTPPRPPADKATPSAGQPFDLTGLTRHPPRSTPSSPTARRRLRPRGGPAARQPALRRALGPPLARPRPLRRDRAHEFDFPIPNAHQYRDYVIRALNADVPYDRSHRTPRRRPAASPARHAAEGFNESILAPVLVSLGEQSTRRWTSARTRPTGSTT